MDIVLKWNQQTSRCEWSLRSGDLAVGNDLETAVLLSIFTDALASPDFVPLDGDPRGWWGDYFSDAPLGSRLWQLDRSKIGDTKQLLAQARDYCIEALAWLISRGIAASLNVTTSMLQQNGTDVLGIGITITEPSGSVVGFQYQWAWNLT